MLTDGTEGYAVKTYDANVNGTEGFDEKTNGTNVNGGNVRSTFFAGVEPGFVVDMVQSFADDAIAVGVYTDM